MQTVENKDDFALLVETIESGNCEKVGEMLHADPRLIKCSDEQNRTALHHAARQNKYKITSILLCNGADPAARDLYEGNTPLHYAAAYEPPEFFVDISSETRNETRTVDVGSKNSVKVIKALLGAGMNPNTRNKLGKTLLHFVPAYGGEAVAEFLIRNGADPQIEDNYGQPSLYAQIRTNICYFCEQREPVNDYAANLKMYKIYSQINIGSSSEVNFLKSKVHIPRCKTCRSIHKRNFYLGLIGIIPGLIAGTCFFGIIASLMDDMFLLATLALLCMTSIGYLAGYAIGISITPTGIKPEQQAMNYALVEKMKLQGWRLEKPNT